MTDTWLTPNQAAEYANCHPETIRVALREQTLKGVQKKVHGRWMTKPSWVDQWIIGDNEELLAA